MEERLPDGGLILIPDGYIMSIYKITQLQSTETMICILWLKKYEWAAATSSLKSKEKSFIHSKLIKVFDFSFFVLIKP